MLDFFQIKPHRIVFSIFAILIALVLLIMIVSGVMVVINGIRGRGGDDYKNTISVQGQGKVYAKPDIAIVDLSVVTEGKNIKDVQDRNTKKMNGVIDFLKDFGIEDKDIKTINYQIYPRYNYENRVIPEIIGYEITQTLEIKIRNLEKIGEILDKSVGAGINQVSSLRFWIDKDDELKEEARKIAIDDAKKKAKNLASELGIKLIKLTGYNDDSSYYPVPVYREELGIGGGGPAPEIQTGENEIVVNVSLIYEID